MMSIQYHTKNHISNKQKTKHSSIHT